MNIIETNLKFKSLNYCNKPKQIFLHHLEWSKCTVQDVHNCHKNEFGWAGIGYHFFVSKNGKIYRGRPENALGSHCKGHNLNSLGIGAEGNYMKETMPQVQKQAIIHLCKYLCNKYNIVDVRGHKEAPYSTDCPGIKYPLSEIKAAIKNKDSFRELRYTIPEMIGKDIEAVQQALKNVKCFQSKIDGIFEKKTQDAVLKYQKDHKFLNQRGIVDKKTWDSIMVHK